VERPIEVTIEATKSVPYPVQRTVGRVVRTVAARSTDVVSGTVIQLVPDGLLRPGAGGAAALAGPTAPAGPAAVAGPAPRHDPRPVPLPEIFAVENITRVDLYGVIRHRLSASDLLDRAGAARADSQLRGQLSALAGNAALERTAGARYGHPTVTLTVPGEPDQMIQVWVRAELSDLRAIAEHRKVGELREVDRSQRVSGESDERGRWMPFGRTFAEDQEGLAGVGEKIFGGAAAAEQSSILSGDRDETSNFEEAELATVSVAVTYHLEVRRIRVGPDNREHRLSTERLPVPASGRATLTLFQHELDAIRRQQATGSGPLWSFDRRFDPAGGTLRVAGSQPSAPDRPDPISAALELAAARGVDVLVEVTERDGTVLRYLARPGASLVPEFPDGGYAAARAALPPDLVQAANRADLDLRDLYRRKPPPDGRTFADIVWEELNPPSSGPDQGPDPGPSAGGGGPAPIGPPPGPEPVGPPLGAVPIGPPLNPDPAAPGPGGGGSSSAFRAGSVDGRQVSVRPDASAQTTAPAEAESEAAPEPDGSEAVREQADPPASGSDAGAATLLRGNGPHPGNSDPAGKLPMTMESVHRVADKYGIDISGMRFRKINKTVRGPFGSTAPDRSTTLYRYAFLSEEQLARTLVHERYHVQQLNSGMGYPETYDAGNAWETAAQAYEDWWWETIGSKVE
jgi:hypothetical protein